MTVIGEIEWEISVEPYQTHLYHYDPLWSFLYQYHPKSIHIIYDMI